METRYKIAREIGALGALALILLAYVAEAGTEGSLKEWYELGLKITIARDPNRLIVGAAIILILVQFAANSRFSEHAETAR